MIATVTYQLVQGLWNPAKDNYSWIVAEEFAALPDARKALDEIIAEDAGLGRLERVTNEHRRNYRGSPMAVMQVHSKVIDKLVANIPELAEAGSSED